MDMIGSAITWWTVPVGAAPFSQSPAVCPYGLRRDTGLPPCPGGDNVLVPIEELQARILRAPAGSPRLEFHTDPLRYKFENIGEALPGGPLKRGEAVPVFLAKALVAEDGAPVRIDEPEAISARAFRTWMVLPVEIGRIDPGHLCKKFEPATACGFLDSVDASHGSSPRIKVR